jgi:nucleoside diphosphate kinase
MLSRFEQQGTDVTGLKAAFASGKMADVKTWMENNRPAQSGRPEGSGHPGFDLTNVTRQQEMLSRFEQQGTDVTGLKAAFASGNMTDVKTWLDANRPAHPGWQPHPR